MVIVEKRKVESCLYPELTRDVFLDQEVNKSFLEFLAHDGTICFYKMGKSFLYKIRIEKKFLITGVEGKKQMRVLYGSNEDLALFEKMVVQYTCEYISN